MHNLTVDIIKYTQKAKKTKKTESLQNFHLEQMNLKELVESGLLRFNGTEKNLGPAFRDIKQINKKNKAKMKTRKKNIPKTKYRSLACGG